MERQCRTDQELALVRAFRRLSVRERETVSYLVSSLAKERLGASGAKVILFPIPAHQH